MNLLFICNQGMHRSRTAAELFARQHKTKSAGLFSESPLTEKELGWADAVIVMEDFQRSEISRRFPSSYMKKRILSLGIPDRYSYNQQELVTLIKSRMNALL
jgi:predicted protein tyrosine phosphatase